MGAEAETGSVRLAELVATLSLAADLGLGQPMEHCMRQSVIGLRLADRMDLGEEERVATYYLGLMRHVYCHAELRSRPSGSATTSASRLGRPWLPT